MPVRVFPVCVIKGKYGEFAVFLDGKPQVPYLTVDRDGAGCFGKPCPDALGNFQTGANITVTMHT